MSPITEANIERWLADDTTLLSDCPSNDLVVEGVVVEKAAEIANLLEKYLNICKVLLLLVWSALFWLDTEITDIEGEIKTFLEFETFYKRYFILSI